MSNIYLSDKEVDLLLVACTPSLWQHTEIKPYNNDFWKVRHKLLKLKENPPSDPKRKANT